MFTGLVEGLGRVKGVSRVRGDMRFSVLPLFDMSPCSVGDSLSVDGVCLTVTGLKEGAFTVDVSGETLARTTLVQLKPGDEVNLERALRWSDRLGGHLVSGHVDGIGRVVRKEQRRRFWILEIGVEAPLSRYLIEKGSVAVDGISLTVNRCHDRGFELTIIPQTGTETHLLKKGVGEAVNIETDLIGKYVEKFLLRAREARGPAGNRPRAIDKNLLEEYGFGE